MELQLGKRALFVGAVVLVIFCAAVVLVRRTKTNPTQTDRPAAQASPSTLPPQPAADLLTDSAAEEVVSETVLAYFSIDSSHQTDWVRAITRVAADPQTVGMLERSIWPEISKAKITSKPSHVTVSQVLAGYDTRAHRHWQVWEAQVSGLTSWPGPAPASIGPLAVPWPTGSELSLYVTVFEQDGQWRFGLFPVKDLVARQLEAGASGHIQNKGEP